MRKRTFLLNALVMAGGTLAIRFLNIGYRVYLSSKIGAEGLGVYQLLLSVFLLAITVSTSGISLAVTRLTAESLSAGNPGRAKSAVRRCIAWALLCSLVATLILCLSSGWIAEELFGDPRTRRPLLMLSFGLPFMGISSCLRGYFVARRKAFQSVTGDLLEQSVTIALVVGAFTFFSPDGLENACCAIAMGSTIGEGISCLYNYISYRINAKKTFAGCPSDGTGVFRTLLHIALPSMAGYTARNVLSAVENILIPKGLRKHGASSENSLAQYGAIHGMALPMLLFPSAFLSAFASLLIPEVAEEHAAGKKAAIIRLVSRSMQMTLLFSFAVTAVFWEFSTELGQAFYHDDSAAELLRILSPLVPLLYLDGIVDSILKGLDQQVSSLKYNFSDSAIRVVLVWFLVPLWGVRGYLCILFFSTIFNAALSIRRLLVVSEVRLRFGDWVLKPALCAAFAAAVARLFQYLPFVSGIPSAILIFLQLLFACVLYFLALRVSGSLSRSDTDWLRSLFH